MSTVTVRNGATFTYLSIMVAMVSKETVGNRRPHPKSGVIERKNLPGELHLQAVMNSAKKCTTLSPPL